MLLPKVSDSFAGRMQTTTLWCPSLRELNGVSGSFIDNIISGKRDFTGLAFADAPEVIEKGMYPDPAINLDQSDATEWYNAYIDALIQRDVRDLAAISNIGDLRRILNLLAATMPGLENDARMSTHLKINAMTFKRYKSLLEALHLLIRIPPYTANIGKRQVKSAKIFLSDTGIQCALTGITAVKMRTDRNYLGSLLETLVMNELVKQAGWSTHKVNIMHWRIHGSSEVDIILETIDGSIIGIEVKAAETVKSNDFNGLNALKQIAGSKYLLGIVLNTGNSTVWFSDSNVAMPVTTLWS